MDEISIAALIPAYQPGPVLIDMVEALAASGFTAIVLIDDGSGPAYRWIFDQLTPLENIRVIRHAVNLGKGAALKTGINYVLVEYPEVTGIVTADADGQHDPADVSTVALRFAENPAALVLGTREFAGKIPLRSRLGNSITRSTMRLVVGQRVSDTQTGLRAVPRGLLERMLSVPASGYEFELEMLIAAKHLGVRVIEQPIRTIYEPGNPTSHFQPLRDSMRIYFVLLRFGFISLVTSGVDNLAFYIFFHASGIVAASLVCARILSLAFNYTFVRKAVFLSSAQHRVVLPHYLLLGAANVCASYGLISFLTSVLPLRVISAKIVAETFLFVANFAIQRDFIFARRSSEDGVDSKNVDSMENAPRPARDSCALLLPVLRRFSATEGDRVGTIAEIGGADGHFLEAVLTSIRPPRYHVIDDDEPGLRFLRKRVFLWEQINSRGRSDVVLHSRKVLESGDAGFRADLVFSAELVDQFNRARIQAAIQAHFDILRNGGHAVIAFRTPGRLYARTTEFFRPGLALDEPALNSEELAAALRERGEIVFETTAAWHDRTQRVMVVRKNVP
jgi:glycosyltransferase involved in cell wall biosynthesis